MSARSLRRWRRSKRQPTRSISAIAAEMGVRNQFLVLNRQPSRGNLGKPSDLPEAALTVPLMPGLTERQLATPVVTGLPEQAEIDRFELEVSDWEQREYFSLF